MIRKTDEPVLPWKNQLAHFLSVCLKIRQVGIEKRVMEEGCIVSLVVLRFFFICLKLRLSFLLSWKCSFAESRELSLALVNEQLSKCLCFQIFYCIVRVYKHCKGIPCRFGLGYFHQDLQLDS